MRVLGLGIDLISLSRARQFLKENRPRAINRLLTHPEKRRLRNKSLTSLQFSKMFAAKEAFFKASGESWMGLEGFRSLEVKFLAHDKFQVRSLKPNRFATLKHREVIGRFFHNGIFLGAQVILYSKD